MRLNRGCGCMLLVLGLANLAFVVGAIVSLAAGSTNAGRDGLAVLVFGANLVAALLLGIAGMRGLPIGGRAPAQEAGELAIGDEGEDSGEESSEE